MSTEEFELLGKKIKPGSSELLELEIAKLHTHTPIKIPIIVNRSKKKGPVVLLLGGVHGDEVNGVSIVREAIKRNYHKPTRGTIICIPVLNIFGYLNQSRYFPDGRDLNRMFPGSKNGSLASQFAWTFKTLIAPKVDLILDFHTGGAQRDNAPQIRCVFNEPDTLRMAAVFDAPFTIQSKYLSKSLRETMHKDGKKTLLFEGGKSGSLDPGVVKKGVRGVLNILKYLGMHEPKRSKKTGPRTVFVEKSKWLRAPNSGMFRPLIENGSKISKGGRLGVITDPFGEFEKFIRAPFDCYVFCINEAPVVNKGNALFHISVSTTSYATLTETQPDNL